MRIDLGMSNLDQLLSWVFSVIIWKAYFVVENLLVCEIIISFLGVLNRFRRC